MSIAFAPAKGYGPENTGVIAHGDADFDVPKALKKGGGVIVVEDEDTALIARLDDYPALEQVPVPKKAATKTEKKEG